MWKRPVCSAALTRRLFAAAPAKAAEPVKRLEKILIANRGEIACRVMQTAKRMGIKTVAVYSDADRDSMHVQMADEAFHIGPPPALQSYLRQNSILDVAKRSGAQAIHPGYGFLSENATFADLCQQEGIVFIGPPPSAIRDMGIKSKAKAIMIAANVPVVPGYHGDGQSLEELRLEADKIGFPVMIKAVLGGGGKGMRIAKTGDDFDEAVESARREAKQAFNDDALLLERYVQRPRHVEVQVFADAHGNAVYLFERDCSVQRRHQKVIEEAPGPGLTPEDRKAIGEAAVRAALAVGYRGAGTVEFIMIPETREFFFMEMNTRLQVEHPVSEMITGTDLVEWQIRVAGNETLPLAQEDIKLNGHAFEARIYAEDTDANFMPAPGKLEHLDVSGIARLFGGDVGPNSVRVETGVREKDEVSIYYDPMIAKLVTWGPDRQTALAKLTQSLAEFHVAGLPTNVNFLLRLAKHEAFKAGDVSTYFIDEHKDDVLPAKPTAPLTAVVKGVVGIFLRVAAEEVEKSRRSEDKFSPWAAGDSFRSCHAMKKSLKLRLRDTETVYEATIEGLPFKSAGNSIEAHCRVNVKDSSGNRQEFDVRANLDPSGQKVHSEIDGVSQLDSLCSLNESFNIFTDEGRFEFKQDAPKFESMKGVSDEGASGLHSPMPGVVNRVEVVPGDQVVKGQTLVVMIAMKMEYVIKAPSAGLVEKVFHKAGDNVARGTELVRLKTDQ